MPISSPVRTSRVTALRRPVDAWFEGFHGHGISRLAIPNTNVVPLPDASFHDERVFRQMRSSPAVLSACEARIRNLFGGGWDLEMGDPEAEGAAEIHGYWSQVLAGLPFGAILKMVANATFDGWRCFEIGAADAQFEGRAVIVPDWIEDRPTHRYQFLASKDLLQLSGLGAPQSVWLTSSSLVHRMKWFTPTNAVANPYGDALLGFLMLHNYLALRFLDVGTGQVQQATGLMKVKQVLGKMETGGTGEAAGKDRVREAMLDIQTELETTLEILRADGIWIEPPGWISEWNDNSGSVDAWVQIWKYSDDLTREVIAGGVDQLSGGPVGSLARSKTHREGGLDAARVDGEMVNEQTRLRLFWPWTAWNLDQITGRQVRSLGGRRSLRDVDPAALPRLRFRRCASVDHEILAVLLSHGSDGSDGSGALKIDAAALARDGHIPLMAEGDEGPALVPGPGLSIEAQQEAEDEEEDGNLDQDEEVDDGPARR